MSKVIVITGASSGIGKTAAFEFLQKGFKVYAFARRVEHMTDIVEFGASIHPVDITKPEQVEDFIQTVINEEGKIDVLIISCNTIWAHWIFIHLQCTLIF